MDLRIVVKILSIIKIVVYSEQTKEAGETLTDWLMELYEIFTPEYSSKRYLEKNNDS